MGEAVSSIRERMVKFYAKDDNTLTLNAAPGHFATSSSHINYYIDVTRLKVRANEAREAARSLKNRMLHHVTTVDTIVCMDGTEVLGAYLAEELEKGHFLNNNKHETVYIVSPEVNSINQLLFRENIRPSIEGKNVLLLLATMTTGETVRKSLELWWQCCWCICNLWYDDKSRRHRSLSTFYDRRSSGISDICST